MNMKVEQGIQQSQEYSQSLKRRQDWDDAFQGLFNSANSRQSTNLTNTISQSNTISQPQPQAKMNQPFSVESFAKNIVGSGISSVILDAAKKANENAGGKHQCYNVAVETARILGHSGDGFSWNELKGIGGKPAVQALTESFKNGILKPGHVVYINQTGVVGRSSLCENPHWFTVLGDENGQIMVADNTAAKLTLEKAVTMMGSDMKVAAVYDPSGKDPNFKPQNSG